MELEHYNQLSDIDPDGVHQEDSPESEENRRN